MTNPTLNPTATAIQAEMLLNNDRIADIKLLIANAEMATSRAYDVADLLGSDDEIDRACDDADAVEIVIVNPLQIENSQLENKNIELGTKLNIAITDSQKSITLEDLQLPRRNYKALTKSGITTIAQLTALTKTKLGEIRNLGSKGVNVISTALVASGLKLHTKLKVVNMYSSPILIASAPVVVVTSKVKKSKKTKIERLDKAPKKSDARAILKVLDTDVVNNVIGFRLTKLEKYSAWLNVPTANRPLLWKVMSAKKYLTMNTRLTPEIKFELQKLGACLTTEFSDNPESFKLLNNYIAQFMDSSEEFKTVSKNQENWFYSCYEYALLSSEDQWKLTAKQAISDHVKKYGEIDLKDLSKKERSAFKALTARRKASII